MKALLLALVAAVLLPLSSNTQTVADDADGSTVPGLLLVKYRDGAEPATTARGAQYNETLDVWRVEVPLGETEAAFAALEGDPEVESVQPAYVYRHAAEPDDPLYQSMQHVHYRAINLQAAWDPGVSASEALVAVVDGGVDVDHPELGGKIWSNGAEVVDGLDNDLNGCIDDLTGCSFQSAIPDGDVVDRDGHGTFAAGLISAESNNAALVAGIAQNSQIMPVRALDPQGVGTTEQLAGSILYAARNGADVINLSLALPPVGVVCPTDPLVESAMQEAVSLHGATVIAAAGNAGVSCVSYPASSDYAIAVGGSGPAESTDDRAFFAQWGPQVDVAAPAMGLISTCPVPTQVVTPYCPGTSTGVGDGTSFSTPIVSGVAALLLGANPDWTPDEVRQRLRDTARDAPDEGAINWDGAGIVDAGAALGAGSAFSSMDMRGDDLSSLSLSVLVGDANAPACLAPMWGRASVGAHATASNLGVGECGAYWPPTPAQPWLLVASSAGGKASVVNSWTLSSNGLSCHAGDLGLIVPAGGSVTASLDCANTGLVDNDQPEGARIIDTELPRQYQQDVRYATVIDEPAATCGPHGHSIWYRVPANVATGGMVVDTLGATFDSLLAVYRDNGGGALTQVACNDSVDYPQISQSRLAFVGDGSADYLVKVAAFATSIATVATVNFSQLERPANDEVVSPHLLTIGGGKQVQPAHNALPAPADPDLSCTGAYGSTVWFSITAVAAGPLIVRTTGSTYDTVLGVFDGTAQVGCNDQEGLNLDTSKVTWAAEAGNTYTIVVGSFSSSAPGVLHIDATVGPLISRRVERPVSAV